MQSLNHRWLNVMGIVTFDTVDNHIVGTSAHFVGLGVQERDILCQVKISLLASAVYYFLAPLTHSLSHRLFSRKRVSYGLVGRSKRVVASVVASSFFVPLEEREVHQPQGLVDRGVAVSCEYEKR